MASSLWLAASSSVCTLPASPPVVQVIVKPSVPQQVFVEERELYAMNPAVQPELREYNGGVVGAVTEANWSYEILRKTDYYETEGGGFCTWYKELIITIKPVKKIVVDERWRNKKCMMGLIVEHEMMHVDAFDITLDAIVPDLERDVGDFLVRIGAELHSPEFFYNTDMAIYGLIDRAHRKWSLAWVETGRQIDLASLDEARKGAYPCGKNYER